MKLNVIKNELERLLYEACVAFIKEMHNDIDIENDTFFSFGISFDDFEAIDVVSFTKNGLKNHIQEMYKLGADDPDIYYEISSAEWDYIGEHSELFLDVNKKLKDFYDYYYDGQTFDDIDLSSFDELKQHVDNMFISVVVDTLTRLKTEGFFKSNIFSDDILLGIQFSDIGKNEIIIIEKISKILNSNYWHDKVLRFKNYIKDYIN